MCQFLCWVRQAGRCIQYELGMARGRPERGSARSPHRHRVRHSVAAVQHQPAQQALAVEREHRLDLQSGAGEGGGGAQWGAECAGAGGCAGAREVVGLGT